MRTTLLLIVILSGWILSACTTGPRTAEQERESEAWFDGEGSD